MLWWFKFHWLKKCLKSSLQSNGEVDSQETCLQILLEKKFIVIYCQSYFYSILLFLEHVNLGQQSSLGSTFCVELDYVKNGQIGLEEFVKILMIWKTMEIMFYCFVRNFTSLKLSKNLLPLW